MSLRIVFMGTPEFAVPTLSEIIGQGHDVVACYTRAPAPGGAGHGDASITGPCHGRGIRHPRLHAEEPA